MIPLIGEMSEGQKGLSSCKADEVEKYFVLFYYEHFVFYTSSVTFGDSFPSRGKPYYAPLVYLPLVEPGVYFHA